MWLIRIDLLIHLFIYLKPNVRYSKHKMNWLWRLLKVKCLTFVTVLLITFSLQTACASSPKEAKCECNWTLYRHTIYILTWKCQLRSLQCVLFILCWWGIVVCMYVLKIILSSQVETFAKTKSIDNKISHIFCMRCIQRNGLRIINKSHDWYITWFFMKNLFKYHRNICKCE